MNDRELLELAAKAAGVEGVFAGRYAADGYPCDFVGIGRTAGAIHPLWNPLVDDGDALRLAVSLDIGVTSKKDHQYEKNTSVAVFNQGNSRITEKHKDHSNDAGKATRYVIVRAAVEIGSQPLSGK